MSNEAGREQAAGEKVGFVQSPRSHLIYTSDGWRLRNPFAGSGGAGRFFLHKIMTGSRLPVITVEKGTTEVVEGNGEEEDLQTCTRASPHWQHPGARACGTENLQATLEKFCLGEEKPSTN